MIHKTISGWEGMGLLHIYTWEITVCSKRMTPAVRHLSTYCFHQFLPFSARRAITTHLLLFVGGGAGLSPCSIEDSHMHIMDIIYLFYLDVIGSTHIMARLNIEFGVSVHHIFVTYCPILQTE